MKNIFKYFHKLSNNQKGTTLIEITIYIFLLLVFITVLTETFVSVLDLQKETESTSSISQDASYITSRFIYDISNAQNIILPNSIGVPNNTLQVLFDSNNYTYALDSANLVLTNQSGNFQLNSFATQVSNLSFMRLGNSGGKNNIQVSFRLTSTTKQAFGQENQDYQFVVGTR